MAKILTLPELLQCIGMVAERADAATAKDLTADLAEILVKHAGGTCGVASEPDESLAASIAIYADDRVARDGFPYSQFDKDVPVADWIRGLD